VNKERTINGQGGGRGVPQDRDRKGRSQKRLHTASRVRARNAVGKNRKKLDTHRAEKKKRKGEVEGSFSLRIKRSFQKIRGERSRGGRLGGERTSKQEQMQSKVLFPKKDLMKGGGVVVKMKRTEWGGRMMDTPTFSGERTASERSRSTNALGDDSTNTVIKGEGRIKFLTLARSVPIGE